MEEENKLKSVDERSSSVEKALDDYEQSIGLPPPKSPGSEEELQEYFSMNRGQIEVLSAKNCSEISYRLAQYALYIQRLTNRESSRVNWAKVAMSEIIAKHFNDYSQYTKYEIKVELISQQEISVQKIKALLNNAQLRLDRLNFLSQNIKYLSEVIQKQSRTNEYKHMGTTG